MGDYPEELGVVKESFAGNYDALGMSHLLYESVNGASP